MRTVILRQELSAVSARIASIARADHASEVYYTSPNTRDDHMHISGIYTCGTKEFPRHYISKRKLLNNVNCYLQILLECLGVNNIPELMQFLGILVGEV